jgi:hypothetical protein
MHSVKRNHLGFAMLDHPPQAYLLGRISNDLTESCGWNDNSAVVFQGGARIEKTRRSFRSSAIRPPASKAIPFTRLSVAWLRAFVARASFLPKRVLLA